MNADDPLFSGSLNSEEYQRQINSDPNRWIIDTTYSHTCLRVALLIRDRDGSGIGKEYAEEFIAYDRWFFRWRVARAKKRLLKRKRLIEEMIRAPFQ